jgi:hypothetical protein
MNQLKKLLVILLISTKFKNYKPDHILNTDQSGFNYLEHSSHTLAIKG